MILKMAQTTRVGKSVPVPGATGMVEQWQKTFRILKMVLRGNGLYYAHEDIHGLGVLKDGRNTGSVIISKFRVGPGHYETKMKPLTRLGACNAFWTYTNRNPTIYSENDNHEIDIELPGGKSNGTISFKNVLNTNYVTEGMNISKDINLNEATKGTTINLADGKFHTFGFDWYTDPEVVIYFVDGYITAISDVFVPTLESKLWLGNWFPNNAGFVGESLFETDYMLVDWVKYVPFKNQPFEAWNASVSVNDVPLSQYPSTPVFLPTANMIANGDFDALSKKEDYSNFGWVFSKLNGYESIPVQDICFIDQTRGYEMSAAAHLKEGGYLSTVVDSVYEGQLYKFSYMSKNNADDARIIISYRDITQTVISKETIKVPKSDDFIENTKDIIPPENTVSISFAIYANDERDLDFLLDDVSLLRGF